MGIAKAIDFEIGFIGDGSSNTMTANVITGPFQYNVGLASGFSPASPTSAINLQCSEHTVSVSISGSDITFTITKSVDDFDDPDSFVADQPFIFNDGDIGSISGKLIYS